MSDLPSLIITVAAIWVWWRYIKHHHTWTEWTDWVETRRSTHGYTLFFRERYCVKCNKPDRHEIGEHDCRDRYGCPHRDIFVAAFDKGVAIKNKERELGL